MANKKVANKDTETKKKNSKKSTTTKKNTSTKTVPKKTVKKPIPKKDTTINKEVANKIEDKIEENVILDNEVNEETITKQEKIEKEVIEEIKNIKDIKLENAKYVTRKKDKSLIAIGVLISLLGIIALILSLIANRLIDREFISDSAVTLMICASIIIEGFGAFIIVNES